MNFNQYADHSGFFRRVSGLFFGKVHSTAVFKTSVKAAKALCGTVWQLLYIRAQQESIRSLLEEIER